MKMTQDLPTRSVTVLAQDPSVRDAGGLPIFTTVTIPNDKALPGPKTSRFHVIDFDASLDRLLAPQAGPVTDLAAPVLALPPGARRAAIRRLLKDPKFHAQNVHAIAASTLLTFESALGRHIKWGFSSEGHALKIAPHAFSDMNAFYSRDDESLVFGYYPKARGSRDYAFTCLCFDIVVHETTHAILDGLRREYMRPSSADQAAFHEAFADIVAILSAFRNDEVISHGLSGEPGETIKKSAFEPDRLHESFLFGLAQELGEALADGSASAIRGGALRRSVAIKPGPHVYRDASRADSPHELGEVLVAAVLSAFIGIWCRRASRLDGAGAGLLDRASAVEEGAKAAGHLLMMSIRALDYLPATNVTFGDFARALITADFETAPDDGRYGYRNALCKAFSDYGIVTGPASPPDLRWGTPFFPEEIVYGFDGHAQMQWDRESVFRFVWENMHTLKLQEAAFTRILSVRPVQRTGPGGSMVRETVAEYLQQINIMSGDLGTHGLRRPKGMNDSTYVELLGGGTLIFDDYGRLKYHVGVGVLGKGQQKRLQALWDAGHYDQRGAYLSRFAELHADRMRGRSPAQRSETW